MCVKDLKVAKIVKQIIFKGMWGELEAKNCFQRQSAKFSFAFYVFFNSHILAGIYFTFLRERLRPNLKVFQYQI